MNSFSNWLLEKCAGKGPTANLRHRLTQEKFQAGITANVSETPNTECQILYRNQLCNSSAWSSREALNRSPVYGDQPAAQPKWVAARRGSNAAIAEHAHVPIYHRSERALVSFDYLDGVQLDDDDDDERPQKKRVDIVGHALQAKILNKKSQSPPKKALSLLYDVPRLPQMVGVGRFRRSATATPEWIQENITIRCAAPIPQKYPYEYGIPGYKPRSPPPKRPGDVLSFSSMFSHIAAEVEYLTVPENLGVKEKGDGQSTKLPQSQQAKANEHEKLKAIPVKVAGKTEGDLARQENVPLDTRILKLGSYCQALDNKLRGKRRAARHTEKGRRRSCLFNSTLGSIKEQQQDQESQDIAKHTKLTRGERDHEGKIVSKDGLSAEAIKMPDMDGTIEHPRQEDEKQVLTQRRVRFAVGNGEKDWRQVCMMRKR